MIQTLRGLLRDFVKKTLNLHDIKDLIIGGHCGSCGQWIPGTIFEKRSPWGVCEDCAREIAVDLKAAAKKFKEIDDKIGDLPNVPVPPPPPPSGELS